MSPTPTREYIHAVRQRHAQASKRAKGQILDELCATLGYHRKAAIRVLAGRFRPRSRRAPRTYGNQPLDVLKAIWEAAGVPWSMRLEALLPPWLIEVRRPCNERGLGSPDPGPPRPWNGPAISPRPPPA